MSHETQTRETRKGGRLIGILLAIVAAGGVVAFFVSGDHKPAPKKERSSEIVNITLPPPPPPPLPPPPPTPEPPEQEKKELVEEAIPAEANEEPEDKTPAPEAPPEALGTGITGDGPGTFGLGNRGEGGGSGQGPSGKGGGGSRFGRYQGMVERVLSSELRRNPALRKAQFRSDVSAWVDRTGRITRISLRNTSGDTGSADAVRAAYVGLQLHEAPPEGMPMPIRIRLTIRPPSS